MSKAILCVTEGRKTEVQILKNIADKFLKDRNINLISFDANIYQLYRTLSEQDFLDTFTVLLENSTEHEELAGKTPDSFTDIFLFFDLDRHATQANEQNVTAEECIADMLQIFSDSTGNGQIYISYPMAEAYKHPLESNTVTDIYVKGGYKKYVAEICDKKLERHLSKIEKSEWIDLFKRHLKNTNDFLHQLTELPDKYNPEYFSQPSIYQKQLKQHIDTNKQVRVISPFALFLLDYLGNPLLDEWKIE